MAIRIERITNYSKKREREKRERKKRREEEREREKEKEILERDRKKERKKERKKGASLCPIGWKAGGKKFVVPIAQVSTRLRQSCRRPFTRQRLN